MELTAGQLETIQALSKEIEFGKVTVSFTGEPSNIVDIVGEKHLRFHHERAVATRGEPVDMRKTGRL
jgi:hypothetical protein